MEAAARKSEVHLFESYQGILELIPNLQYGRPVSLTHPDDAVLPHPQPPTPPVPYAVYLHQWDGGSGWRGEGGGGRKGDGRERGNRPRTRYKADYWAISEARGVVVGGKSKGKGTGPGPTGVVLGVAHGPPLHPLPGIFEGPRSCCLRQEQGQGHHYGTHRGGFGGRPPPLPPPAWGLGGQGEHPVGGTQG